MLLLCGYITLLWLMVWSWADCTWSTYKRLQHLWTPGQTSKHIENSASRPIYTIDYRLYRLFFHLSSEIQMVRKRLLEFMTKFSLCKQRRCNACLHSSIFLLFSSAWTYLRGLDHTPCHSFQEQSEEGKVPNEESSTVKSRRHNSREPLSAAALEKNQSDHHHV